MLWQFLPQPFSVAGGYFNRGKLHLNDAIANVAYKTLRILLHYVYDHTTMNTPVLV